MSGDLVREGVELDRGFGDVQDYWEGVIWVGEGDV